MPKETLKPGPNWAQKKGRRCNREAGPLREAGPALSRLELVVPREMLTGALTEFKRKETDAIGKLAHCVKPGQRCPT